MCKRYDLSNIREVVGRDIFFDANILIYLFWPTGKKQRYLENNYASIYSKILSEGIEKNVNFVVISEVINKILRISWEEHLNIENLQKDELSFKDFRNSNCGIEAQEDVITIIEENVLKNFEIVEDSFSKTDIEQFFEIDLLDFSDKAILKTCIDNDFILLTHDSDFSDSEVDILTCNKNIL